MSPGLSEEMHICEEDYDELIQYRKYYLSVEVPVVKLRSIWLCRLLQRGMFPFLELLNVKEDLKNNLAK